MKPQFLLTALTVNMALAFSAHADAGSLLREARGAVPSVSYGIATSDTPIQVKNIVLKGNTLLPADEVRAYLERSAPNVKSLAQLQALAGELGDIYHQAGYPLATVIVPAQTIDGGQVVLQAIEGKVDAIALENRSKIHDQIIKDTIAKTVRFGKPLHSAESERAQLLIGDLAGTAKVGYRLDKAGLVLQVEPATALDGFVQVDNYGSKSTGEARVRAGMTINSPTGHGERVGVQAMTSFQGVNYARLSADVPVGGDGLVVSAGVGHTRYALGGAFKDLNATGEATSVDIGVRYPKVRSHAQSLWLNASAEHRALLDTIKTSQTETKKSLNAVHFGASGFAQYAHANAQYSAEAAVGHLHHVHDADRAYDKAAANTQGVYAKISASGSYTHHIGASSLGVSVRGQWASKNLDSAEQLSLGGVDGVAAYSANAVSADQAVIAQLQARHRVGAFSVGGFYDIASAKLRAKPYLQDANTTTLKGYGVLAQGNYQGVNIQGKLAWQVGKVRPQTWISVGYNF